EREAWNNRNRRPQTQPTEGPRDGWRGSSDNSHPIRGDLRHSWRSEFDTASCLLSCSRACGACRRFRWSPQDARNLQATPYTSLRLAPIDPWNSISGSNLQLNASRTLVRTVPPPSNLSFDDTCRNFR